MFIFYHDILVQDQRIDSSSSTTKSLMTNQSLIDLVIIVHGYNTKYCQASVGINEITRFNPQNEATFRQLVRAHKN